MMKTLGDLRKALLHPHVAPLPDETEIKARLRIDGQMGYYDFEDLMVAAHSDTWIKL